MLQMPPTCRSASDSVCGAWLACLRSLMMTSPGCVQPASTATGLLLAACRAMQSKGKEQHWGLDTAAGFPVQASVWYCSLPLPFHISLQLT